MNNISNYFELCMEYQRQTSLHIQQLYNLITLENNRDRENNNDSNINRNQQRSTLPHLRTPLQQRRTYTQQPMTPLQQPRTTMFRSNNNPPTTTRTVNTPINDAQVFFTPLNQTYSNDINNLLNTGIQQLLMAFDMDIPLTTQTQTQNQTDTETPTNEQIENAIERLTYQQYIERQNSDVNHSELVCPIDLLQYTDDDTIVRIKHCNHTFREDNILNWFRNNVRCPLCRFDIRNYQENNDDSIL